MRLYFEQKKALDYIMPVSVNTGCSYFLELRLFIFAIFSVGIVGLVMIIAGAFSPCWH